MFNLAFEVLTMGLALVWSFVDLLEFSFAMMSGYCKEILWYVVLNLILWVVLACMFKPFAHFGCYNEHLVNLTDAYTISLSLSRKRVRRLAR